MKLFAVSLTAIVVLLLAPGCPGGGDLGDAGEDASVDGHPDAAVDAGTLTLSAPGPLVWYLDAVNAYSLSATGGTSPYSWQVTEKPPALSWLTLEASGTLTGTATALGDTQMLLGVRAVDSVGAFGQASFAIEVRACQEGSTQPCGAHDVGDVCIEGTRTCSGGRFGPCTANGEPSDLFFACGAGCGSCDLQRATACVGGRCQCGDLPSCGDTETCCLGDGGSTELCATLAHDVNNCGACGKVCPPDAGDPDASVPTCEESVCGSHCADGANLCDDGCRWARNMNHCGGCNRVCPSNPPNTEPHSANCDAAVCAATCLADHGDCNADIALDGCETALKTSTAHCGQCGNACTGLKDTCVDGACGQPCGGAPAPGGFYCFGTKSCGFCSEPDPEGGSTVYPCCK